MSENTALEDVIGAIDVSQLPDVERDGVTAVYAVGDIHGRLDLLEVM